MESPRICLRLYSLEVSCASAKRSYLIIESTSGLSSEEKLHGVKYIIESFVGCIRNIVLKSGKAASDLLPITPLVASKHENVVEGCHNKCDTRENLCFVGSRCVNHFSSYSCDCFGTKYEGEQCDIYCKLRSKLKTSRLILVSSCNRSHSPRIELRLLPNLRLERSNS
jgi:hypothetical protein